MITNNNNLISRNHKLFLIKKFLDSHPKLEIQDLYAWQFFGEFGYPEQNELQEGLDPFHKLLKDIKTERELNISPTILWEPLGLSLRFIKIYISAYYHRDCPVKRLINLMDRSKAFDGSRMQFKLDWSLSKDYIMGRIPEFTRKEFAAFEERINFHQLPILPFSETYHSQTPFQYRIVSLKLFLDYFPEYEDMHVLNPFKSQFSII